MNKTNIEEDIKIVNDFLVKMKSDFRTGLGYKEEIQAIENILVDRERLKKENEDYKIKENSRIAGKYNEIEIHDLIEQTIQKDYIAKANKYDSLIKEIEDKIENYENLIKECENDEEHYGEIYLYKIYIDVLQELLDKQKEKYNGK